MLAVDKDIRLLGLFPPKTSDHTELEATRAFPSQILFEALHVILSLVTLHSVLHIGYRRGMSQGRWLLGQVILDLGSGFTPREF